VSTPATIQRKRGLVSVWSTLLRNFKDPLKIQW
jgi:hypothetical protein